MFKAPKSIPEPLPTQPEFIRELLDSTPEINKEEILTSLIEAGLSKSETPIQSYNRAIASVLKERGIEVTRKNPVKAKTVIETQDGISKRSDDDFARDDFIDREIEDDFDDDVWYKKILKTGETKNPKWKTSTDIEAVTFEKNDINRFQDMLDTIVDNIMEISYIDKAGYDQERIGADFIDEEAQYPNIRVTFTNAGGVTTKYIP
tara:strand:- start:290 stop:904 length:615 start_codon:yes stop_codon:yes gene_type:complete